MRPYLLPLTASVLALAACSSLPTLPGLTRESASAPAAAISPEPVFVPRTFEGTGADWRNLAQAELAARINRPHRDGTARNIILFVADGLSLGTITATRIYDGQSRGESGEENVLPFERWGHTALIKTYSENAQVPDSAATASALHTGIKTHSGAISVYARQTLETCGPDADLPQTILETAEDRGLATGLVSTARISHATPATTYAHVPDRGWEVDSSLPPEAVAAGCRDIARQFIEFSHGDGIDIALGGGRGAFLPRTEGGLRTDGRNLTAEWQAAGGHLVMDRDTLLAAADETAPVLGLFSASYMSYALDQAQTNEPTLTEMTEAAINHLSRDPDGFYLLVEAGRVDHAHHATNAARALSDAQEFARAVERAAQMVDLDETLILVTADHSHTFTIAGYARRGNPILGLSRPAPRDLSDDPTPPEVAQDGRPYTTLGYANGGHQRPASGVLTDAEVLDPDYRQESAVPMGSQTHSGEDVIAFATGPQAHLVDGVMEQHTLYHIMIHALGWDRD